MAKLRSRTADMIRRFQRYADAPVQTFKPGGIVEPGVTHYARESIPLTKRQQKIAEALAKKRGISVDQLTRTDHYEIRTGKITLKSAQQTRSEINTKLAKEKNLRNLEKWKPIDPDTGKVYTEEKWLSLSTGQRSEKLRPLSDPKFKEKQAAYFQKYYLKYKGKIQDYAREYHYTTGRDKRKSRLSGPRWIGEDRNIILSYMRDGKDYTEIRDKKNKIVGYRDNKTGTNWYNHAYKNHPEWTKYKQDHVKHQIIGDHPMASYYEKHMQEKRKFKHSVIGKELEKYFSKSGKIPTLNELAVFMLTSPEYRARISPLEFGKGALQFHHIKGVKGDPAGVGQLVLSKLNNKAGKLVQAYIKGRITKTKLIEEARKINVPIQIPGEKTVVGGHILSPATARKRAEDYIKKLFLKEVKDNPKIGEQIVKILKQGGDRKKILRAVMATIFGAPLAMSFAGGEAQADPIATGKLIQKNPKMKEVLEAAGESTEGMMPEALTALVGGLVFPAVRKVAMTGLLGVGSAVPVGVLAASYNIGRDPQDIVTDPINWTFPMLMTTAKDLSGRFKGKGAQKIARAVAGGLTPRMASLLTRFSAPGLAASLVYQGGKSVYDEYHRRQGLTPEELAADDVRREILMDETSTEDSYRDGGIAALKYWALPPESGPDPRGQKIKEGIVSVIK